MAMGYARRMTDLENLLEGLSQEEKLALLERLIRGEGREGAAASRTNASVDERLERLERQQPNAFALPPWEAFRRTTGFYPWQVCCGGWW